MKKNVFILGSISLLALMVTIGCSKEEDDPIPVVDTVDPLEDEKIAIKQNYAEIVYWNYQDSYDAAVDMQTALIAFVSAPTATSLATAKQSWLDAREPYGQTEAFRFANGPIDDADGPEGALNAWPLDESYIDYTFASSVSGIINDATTYPTIDAQLLTSLNEAGGEENISIGYHAIEFLLWGQDDPNTALQTPGNRPYTDFISGAGGTASNADRRKDYLLVVADLLIADLQSLVDEWDPNTSGNFRTQFLNSPDDAALQAILTGIGTLSKSELAGERMFTALSNQDQEDEHSCFSDNTHRDIILNAQGIRNVYTGTYTKLDGSIITATTSIQDLIGMVNSTISSDLDALSTASITTTTAMPVPFDYALTQETIGGTGPIMTAITTLQNQGDKISQLATALGITISVEL